MKSCLEMGFGMEDILYVKVDQRIQVQKKQIMMKDLGTFYCYNKKVSKEVEKEIFYTLEDKGPKENAFTITKVYEVIHRLYPNIVIENLGEQDFIVEYQKERNKSKFIEYAKTVFASLIIFFGAAFTIMTFDEDVSVSRLFDHIYKAIMGSAKSGGSTLEFFYCLGLPLGLFVFYNHFKKNEEAKDPTPIEIEMRNYEEEMNRAMIKTCLLYTSDAADE